MSTYRATMTCDEFLELLRREFGTKKIFKMAEVKELAGYTPRITKTAAEVYVYQLHQSGHISCTKERRPNRYVLNETPVCCPNCAAREEARTIDDFAKDIEDIHRIIGKVKGTGLGSKIEMALAEIKNLADIARAMP